MARVLGVIRLSKDREESTSPERQRESIAGYAAMHGHEIVAWAEDLDVSGSVAPWLRDDLGRYIPNLDDPKAVDESLSATWDLIVSWKLDRLSRKVLHVVQLNDWCKRNGKSLASVNDGFDLESPIGNLVFTMLAGFAEMELETIRFRARSSTAELVKTGRYRGSKPPYGYRGEKREGGGHRLVVDDVAAGVIRDVVARVLDGQSVASVAGALNTEGVHLPPADYARVVMGREPKGSQWRPPNLVALLRSQTLLGYGVSNGKVVRGDDGLPLQRAEPILDHETFERLQSVLTERARNKGADVRKDRSLLLGVAYCECGSRLYARKMSGRTDVRRYGCGTAATSGLPCPHGVKTFSEHDLDELTERVVLQTIGNVPQTERVLIPGESHAQDLAAVNAALQNLETDRAAGMYEGGTALQRFREQYRTLSERADHLAGLPVVPARYDEVPTGKTYRQAWEAAERTERNKLLSALGLRVILHVERQRALGIAEMVQGDNYVHREGRVTVLIPTTIYQKARS